MSDEPARSAERRRGTRFWVMVVAIVVAAVFIIQNSQHVDVKFFFSTTNTPLVLALLLAAILGFIIGLALPRFRRHDD